MVALVSAEQAREAREALGLLRSIIFSGESWTDTASAKFDAALAALDSLAAVVERQAEALREILDETAGWTVPRTPVDRLSIIDAIARAALAAEDTQLAYDVAADKAREAVSDWQAEYDADDHRAADGGSDD